jgi:hypothetical protein
LRGRNWNDTATADKTDCRLDAYNAICRSRAHDRAVRLRANSYTAGLALLAALALVASGIALSLVSPGNRSRHVTLFQEPWRNPEEPDGLPGRHSLNSVALARYYGSEERGIATREEEVPLICRVWVELKLRGLVDWRSSSFFAVIVSHLFELLRGFLLELTAASSNAFASPISRL